MPRPKNEDFVKISDVPKLLIELTGITKTRICIYQWMTKGRKTYDGRTVVLKTTRRLGQYYTTRQWVEEFIRSLS